MQIICDFRNSSDILIPKSVVTLMIDRRVVRLMRNIMIERGMIANEDGVFNVNLDDGSGRHIEDTGGEG